MPLILLRVTAGGVMTLKAALKSSLLLLPNALTTAPIASHVFITMAAVLKVTLPSTNNAIPPVLLTSKREIFPAKMMEENHLYKQI